MPLYRLIFNQQYALVPLSEVDEVRASVFELFNPFHYYFGAVLARVSVQPA